MMIKPIADKVISAGIILVSILIAGYFGAMLIRDNSFSDDSMIPNYARCDMLRTHCTIRLSEMLGPTPDQFQQVYYVLDTAYPWTRISMHVDGNGGAVTTTQNLMGAVRESSATVTMIVSSRAYSGHAFLLLAADKLNIADDATIIYHRSSLYGQLEEACKGLKGQKDRTHDAEDKCLEIWGKYLKIEEENLKDELGDILTPEELKKVIDGREVILSGKEFNRRIAK